MPDISLQRFGQTLVRTRARRLMVAAVAVALFLVAFADQLYASILDTLGVLSPVLYHLAVIGWASLTFFLFATFYSGRRLGSVRVLWGGVFYGIGFALVSALLLSLNHAPRPNLETQHPGDPLTAIVMVVLVLAETLVAFGVLTRLRELVLFKRTRASLRGWRLMLAAFAVTALLTAGHSPLQNFDTASILALIVAVGLMIPNVFRLSWIVFLPLRQKVLAAGLTLAMSILLCFALGAHLALFEMSSAPLLQFYSYPLATFNLLAIGFSAMYGLTAVLSLLFHLPTTGDFQKKSDEIEAIHALTRLHDQVFDAHRLVATIAAAPAEAGMADATWVALINPRSGSLRPQLAATHNIAPHKLAAMVDVAALSNEALEQKGALELEQAATDHRVRVRPGDSIGSLLAVPLTARGEPLGALFAAREVAHGFEKDDIAAIAAFADQASLAFDNARLFEERLEKERLARELAIAHEMQQKLLPQRVPEVGGLTLAASSAAAMEVCGDFYDFVQIDEDRLGILVADVSGKGTSAAFYMAELKGIFQALARTTSSPADFLIRANEALADSLDKKAFISAVYGVIDLEKEEFVMARAGHCPTVTTNFNGETQFIRSNGIGLGLVRGKMFGSAIEEITVPLTPGDAFVLYTDGIVESRSPRDEEYGYDRLAVALREHRHEDAEVIREALLDDLHGFLQSEQYDDDLTLVVVKWHGIRSLPYPTDSTRHTKPSTQEVG